MKINKLLYFAFTLLLFQNQIVCQELTIDLELQDNRCYNSNDGSAIANVSGGTPPYSYLWSNSETTSNIDGLEAGLYNVTVEDFIGTTASSPFIISEPMELIFSTSTENASCFGYDDGEAIVYVNGGGTPPYSFLWPDGNTTQNMIAGAGTYTVTISDANGCQKYIDNIISQPESIYVSPINDVAICSGVTITRNANATGGTFGVGEDYVYVWTGSDETTFYGNTLTVSPDQTTTYQLFVTDANGCFSEPQTFIVSLHPDVIIENLDISTNEICSGESVTIDISYSGGHGFYTITSEGGIINSNPYTFYPAISDWYTFSVSDDCGSTASDSVFITVNQSSVSSSQFSELKSFPNPVREMLYFENIPNQTSYEIINSKGELIESGRLKNKINMSSYSSGQYLIKLFTKEHEFITKKIFVE